MWIAAATAATTLAVSAGTFVAGRAAWRKNMHLWLPGTLARRRRHDWRTQSTDVFLSVCDHYEPEWGKPDPRTALERVGAWRKLYPQQFSDIRDDRGRSPQHTFFFPADEYRPEYLDEVALMCREGAGEVEVHLHHDNDTAENLRNTLLWFRNTLYQRHGLLRRDPVTGEIVWGFIHGNWSLCNCRPDGRWCGVDQELTILRETGCYADFTLPSAPSPTQTRIVNSIYYAQDRPGRRKSHDSGRMAAAGQSPADDGLLMIQGPLRLDFHRRKYGVVPRIENSDLTRANPPTMQRWPNWLDAGVSVVGRPDWLFVKLHTHGCQPDNQRMWLGGAARQFHLDLAEWRKANPHVRVHYVTAWEQAQLVHQAEAGLTTPAWERLVGTDVQERTDRREQTHPSRVENAQPLLASC
jgi:hypothetical protein